MKVRKITTKPLQEMFWTEVTEQTPSTSPSKVVYYYASSIQDAQDSIDMLYNGTKRGTFKQQINANALATLKSMNGAFKITGLTALPKTATTDEILTRSERSLRKDAHNRGAQIFIDAGVNIPNTLKHLIHHKNFQEYDNTPENLVLILSEDNAINDAVHKLIHKGTKVGGSASVNAGTYTADILELQPDPKNSGMYIVVSHKATLTIS